MFEHEFTKEIRRILKERFGAVSEKLFISSQLLQYLNIKTKAANKGSKSRGSFANLYAIYVLVEDYLSKGFHKSGKYRDYEGAVFTVLFKRQRELPFGQKLQNHALNSRLNEEFKKYFPMADEVPIIRDLETNRYWLNENLLRVKLNGKTYNIAEAAMEIIDAYTEAKKDAFEKFMKLCDEAQKLKPQDLTGFIASTMTPAVDARIFEIVSYSILKYYYYNQRIYWGFKIDKLKEENLTLFKTGRTNANDGGIDFVMKPLGRFFQVTETVDVKKYFLDIDKIEKYPITFVVKSSDSILDIRKKIQKQAEQQYPVNAVVKRYMACIEEIINLPDLLEKFRIAVEKGHLRGILNEVIKQSKVEFNYDDDYDLAHYDDFEIV